MIEPQTFFSDPIESELAAEVWKVAGNTGIDIFFQWTFPHDTMLSMVETPFQKRVITARNWITNMRDRNEAWGENGIQRIETYFKQTYNRDFKVTNTQIGNVELYDSTPSSNFRHFLRTSGGRHRRL